MGDASSGILVGLEKKIFLEEAENQFAGRQLHSRHLHQFCMKNAKVIGDYIGLFLQPGIVFASAPDMTVCLLKHREGV